MSLMIFARGGVVGGVGVAFDEGIRDDAQAARAVVEDEQRSRRGRTGSRAGRVRPSAAAAIGRLEEADDVVAEVTDGTAGEARPELRRLIRERDVAEARHEPFQVGEGIFLQLQILPARPW